MDLVKIDVEGMEIDVLRGGEQLLTRFKPALYVENDRLDTSEALIRLIASFDYRMYWHTPPLFNPDNFFENSHDLFPEVVSANMLCFHRSSNYRAEGFQEIVDFTAHPILRRKG